MIPTTIRRNSGAMSANSTRACPLSRERLAPPGAPCEFHDEPMGALSAVCDPNVSPRFLPDPRLGPMFPFIVPLLTSFGKGELRNAYAGPVEGVTGPAHSRCRVFRRRLAVLPCAASHRLSCSLLLRQRAWPLDA